MNAITAPAAHALQTAPGAAYDLSPRNFEEAWRMADILAKSDMVPKDYKGRPENCLIAMQWGAEVGLKALQAMQNIAVINGRPALWGDSVLALVRSSPLCEYVTEIEDATSSTCIVKRRGEAEQRRTFTDDDAKKAGLFGKQGPWQQYPRRMRQMRARAFALRDVFPDVLRGLPVAEEAMDAPPLAEKHMGPAEVVQPQRPALPAYDQAAFDKNLPAWSKLVADGKKTPGELLAMLSTKATFNEEQKARILSLKRAEPAAEAPPPVGQAAPPAGDDDFAAEYEAAEEGSK
jgi:hypothetical protein